MLLSGLESTAEFFPPARPTKCQGLEDLPGVVPLTNLPDEGVNEDEDDRTADPDYKFYGRHSADRETRQEKSSDSTDTVTGVNDALASFERRHKELQTDILFQVVGIYSIPCDIPDSTPSKECCISRVAHNVTLAGGSPSYFQRIL